MIGGMNLLSPSQCARIVSCFAEGNSVRSTSRMLDISPVTVLKFLTDMGTVCSEYQDRVQLTTDGHNAYLSAVEEAFGADVDYSQLIKVYGSSPENDTRYSPGECLGCEHKRIVGNPDPDYVSTSYVERQNLSMRMGMRRFTRLTNGFSKKIENHIHAISIYFMHYNFARIHKTLRCTPAMAAGITDHVWELEEIVGLLGNAERKDSKRGPYKKRAS